MSDPLASMIIQTMEILIKHLNAEVEQLRNEIDELKNVKKPCVHKNWKGELYVLGICPLCQKELPTEEEPSE